MKTRRLSLGLLAGLVLFAGLACSESTEALYLRIQGGALSKAPSRLTAYALITGQSDSERAMFSANLSGQDLRSDDFVMRLDVPAGSDYDADALLAVVAWDGDTPIGNAFEEVDLGAEEVITIPLAPLPTGCDLDKDGFVACDDQGICCPGDAPLVSDCDDSDAALAPFAAEAACRDCRDEDGDEQPDCLADGPDSEPGDVVEETTALDVTDETDTGDDTLLETIDTSPETEVDACEPACSGRVCGDDGCGSTCGTCAEYETCSDTGRCIVTGMTLVASGAFWMGCNPSLDANCTAAESPQHEVQVPAFQIDRLEISNEAYGTCVADGACTAAHWDDGSCFVIKGDVWDAGVLPARFRDPLMPVVCVDWNEAKDYCEWRCPECRLCGEAEWEKAARGGCLLYEGKDCQTATPKYPWGNAEPVAAAASLGGPVGNFADEAAKETYGLDSAIIGYTDGYADLSPAGSFPLGSSPYGVMDLSGNVWEWLADCWHPDFTDAPSDGSTWTEACDGSYVRRGGSWVVGAHEVRGGMRASYDAAVRADVAGFRCCR
jgi:formylglycine-generating enzyme required for sulfatase activity